MRSAKFSRGTMELFPWLCFYHIYRFLTIFLSMFIHIQYLDCTTFEWDTLFFRHALLFEDIGGEFNIPLAANAKSVREFDEGLTRGLHILDAWNSCCTTDH